MMGTMPRPRSFGYLVAPARETVQPHLAAQQIGGAQRDVAAAN